MYRLVTSLLRFTNAYNPHQALGARTAVPRVENCRTGATMTKLDKNSTHIVFHNHIHKLTSYMAGHKSFDEYPDKKLKCEMDVVWRQQHNLKREYHLTNQQNLPLDRAE